MRTEDRNVEDNFIPVIEFVRPRGKRVYREIECDKPEVLQRAQELIEAGYFFNVELFGNSCAINITSEDYDVATSIVSANGNEKLIEMIMSHTVYEFDQIARQYDIAGRELFEDGN